MSWAWLLIGGCVLFTQSLTASEDISQKDSFSQSSRGVLKKAIASFGKKKELTNLSWYDLMDFDTDTGKSSAQLDKKLKGPIKVVGFIVPLLDDGGFETVTEFYLVPDPMMCIHVPPPPPNQMLHIKMDVPVPLDSDFEGVWIFGEITKKPTPIEYGEPGYIVRGRRSEACDDYPYDEFLDPLLEVIDEESLREPENSDTADL